MGSVGCLRRRRDPTLATFPGVCVTPGWGLRPSALVMGSSRRGNCLCPVLTQQSPDLLTLRLAAWVAPYRSKHHFQHCSLELYLEQELPRGSRALLWTPSSPLAESSLSMPPVPGSGVLWALCCCWLLWNCLLHYRLPCYCALWLGNAC